MKLFVMSAFIVLFSIAGGATVFAAPANHEASRPAAQPSRYTEALPAALRPALYQALSEDAGSAAQIGVNGCAVLPKQALKACFTKRGAHFTGASSSLALHVAAYGRGDKLSPVTTVRPKIDGNRVNYVHGDLTAWWRMLPMGFEQGFTLAKRPSGHGELIIALDTSDGASQHGDALAWGKLRYGQLVVTDARGKVIQATLKNESNRILIAVNDVNATYPLTVDPLVWPEQEVTASDGVAHDEFGYSVAVSGSTALVGVPDATVNGNGYQGAAYVFTMINGTWAQSQKLIASDGAVINLFGLSVAVSGTTALIGAPDATINGNVEQGAAYVFTNTGGTWVQTQKLTANDGAADDQFGWASIISGTTALIGASAATVNGNSAQGAVYVFSASGGTWTQTQKLTANDGSAGDLFGLSAALDGSTALIGAPQGQVGVGGTGPGKAYVFSETTGNWTQTQELTASDGETGDVFGGSVALSGTTALVGAPVAVINGNFNQGAAYVFSESGGNWSQTAKLTASDGAMNNYFGTSVALSGVTAFIGAPDADVNGNAFQGTAYLFSGLGGTWAQTQKFAASDSHGFGNSTAFDGATVFFGAFGTTIDGNSAQGAAYFFGESDLSLNVSAPQMVGQGQQYTSQTIATNSSSAASPAVSATITVPAAASFVSATASQGSCNEAAGVVTCDFGQIAGNAGMATANVTLKATGSAGTTIENTASVARATPALTASAPTGITSPAACQPGYTEFSGHLDAGETFTSSPITVTEAGQKYVDLTSPASFGFFAIVTSSYGTHTYIYPHAKQGHRWGAAGSYRVGVQAGPDAGGDYTLCVNLNPAQ